MKALVIGVNRGNFKILDQETNQIYLATLVGMFRNKENYIFAGDMVEYKIEEGLAQITKLLPRRNLLLRPGVSNVDQIFLITSLKKPDLNLYLVDKMLVLFEYYNIDVALIFTKKDLLTESELESARKVVDYYQEIGYPSFITDQLSTDLINQLPIKKGKINVFCGQSGVGKSSLLNLLDKNLNLETKEISDALNRGRHTTRTIDLYQINDALIADTPGFGSVELFELDEASLAMNTREFFTASSSCKYKGCLHQNEPDCKVKELVRDGIILKSRYDNYLLFLDEIRGGKRK